MKSCKDRLLRKVRIIVNDPDATDDSSSDEWFELPKPPKVKRIVHEITLPYKLCDCECCCQDRRNDVRTSGKKAPPRQSNNPVGVRLRKSGKWAAEIKNPFTKTKKWLGTYETIEEAAKAYADKKVEYDALVSSGHAAVSTSVVSVNSHCLRSPSAPPCVNAGDLCKEEKMSLNKDDAAVSGLDFSDLQIPDLSLIAAEEEQSMVFSGGNGVELDFDGFLEDDFSLLDSDMDIGGFENSVPSELPDFDFTDVELGDLKFAFSDQLAPPLNIACP